MKLSTNLVVDDLQDVAEPVRSLEALGFETLYISERKHEPFMQLAVAAVNSERIKLGPEIALTFPRNPMVLAYTALDLQRASKGRFILGLGTQVKAHNERRFGLKWERPAAKLREYILAIRHIWDCWQNSTELDFAGEFFNFNLMTPMFDPGPLEVGPPPIYVGAVNPMNCRMAGEIADGFHCHGFHTAGSLRARVIDNIEEGLAHAGRKRSDFTITAPVMVVMGGDEQEVDVMRERVRGMIGFYGATSYYKDMFEANDWGDTFARLLKKSRTGRWDSMADEITDEMIDEFAVTGYYEEIPDLLKEKYGDMLDEVLIYFGEPEKGDPDTWARLVKAFNDSES
ncbi:MAG: TIGR03617 family F420-dependent LLM class oxidoreductase [Deltaproteobacteria bacterium]|nr:TIGR03617 family F420-dependent LLM class oxidoreductase [Deltaproteobacteria bacterium]